MAQTNHEDDANTARRKITIKLIADHNIPDKLSLSGDKIAEALLKLSHVRLDRLHVGRIENLDCLGCVTNLYLQQNHIECIENLEPLTNLRFLTLAGNKIKKIQNLKSLKQLKFLDLSYNLIEHCDADEVPVTLLVLSLKDNPCGSKKEYRNIIINALPNLKELDGIAVGEQENEDNVSNSSDENDIASDNEDDITMDNFEEEDNLKLFTDDIVARAKVRCMKQNEEHYERMFELERK